LQIAFGLYQVWLGAMWVIMDNEEIVAIMIEHDDWSVAH
jgi:hypothetical protein